MSRPLLILGITLAASTLILRDSIADQSKILGQLDYNSDERRTVLLSDIRSAGDDERDLLTDLSIDCEWPLETDIYLTHDLDAVVPECHKESKQYLIEFIQQEREEEHWRKPKRELDRQFYEVEMLEFKADSAVSIMKSAYNAKTLIDGHRGSFSFAQAKEARERFVESQGNLVKALDALNRFYSALGDSLKAVREGRQK